MSTWSGLFQNGFHFAWLVASFVLPSFCLQSRILRELKASLVIETAKTNLEKANTKLATVRDKQRMLSDKNKELFIEGPLPGLPSRKLNAPSWIFFQITVVCSINFSRPEKEAIYISFYTTL